MRTLPTVLLLLLWPAAQLAAGEIFINGSSTLSREANDTTRFSNAVDLAGGSAEGGPDPLAVDASAGNGNGSTNGSSTPADLLQVYLHMREFNELMKRPYGAVFPAVLGAACALATFGLLCCIHACVRAVARRRRRRRIRSLADSLKKDRTMLLGEDSDSEDDDF